MMPRATPLALAALLSACVPMRLTLRDLEEAERLIEQSKALLAQQCAPVVYADAVADASFARLELAEADLGRAREHTEAALANAREAFAKSERCGRVDYDGDGLADIVDKCPRQPEDKDGDRDEDGCPDTDPQGDEDKDGVLNLRDACPNEPEDRDGDADTDGCPEASADSDRDGVIDITDTCPNEAEDKDAFKDSDGCPDPDNDADGVLDAQDRCPAAAEDKDGYVDDDGCPDRDNDADGVADEDDRCPNEAGLSIYLGCATDPGVVTP